MGVGGVYWGRVGNRLETAIQKIYRVGAVMKYVWPVFFCLWALLFFFTPFGRGVGKPASFSFIMEKRKNDVKLLTACGVMW